MAAVPGGFSLTAFRIIKISTGKKTEAIKGRGTCAYVGVAI
jgi:hypothetical protein